MSSLHGIQSESRPFSSCLVEFDALRLSEKNWFGNWIRDSNLEIHPFTVNRRTRIPFQSVFVVEWTNPERVLTKDKTKTLYWACGGSSTLAYDSCACSASGSQNFAIHQNNTKDVRANCFYASSLRTQLHMPRHASSNDRADDHRYSFAWN